MGNRVLFLSMLLLIPALAVVQPTRAQPTVLVTFHTNPTTQDFMIIFDGVAYTDGGVGGPFETNVLHNATAKAGTGYYFDRWTNSSGVIVENHNNPTTRVNLTGSPGSVELTANFLPNADVDVQCGGSTCSVTSNSTITSATYDPSTGNLTITFSGPPGISAYANITYPRAPPNDDPNDIRVYLDGSQLSASGFTINQNSTHFFIYVTFTFQSPETLTIFPLSSPLGVGPYIALSAIMLIIPIILAGRRLLQRRIGAPGP